MDGARRFFLGAITRNDVVAMNKETAKVTGLEYVIEANDAVANSYLKGSVFSFGNCALTNTLQILQI